MKKDAVDVLVIGAGPSGTVAAAALQQRGISCRIVEKQQFPRFVIGESLLPRCMEHFEEVGLLEVLKVQNYQIKKGARFIRDGKECWFDFSEKYSKGWNWTWQVPRDHFDKVLADAVEERGVKISYNASVTDVKMEGTNSTTTIQYLDGSSEEIEAKYIIDASGYGRVLPRLFGLDKPSGMPPRKAVFGHFVDTKRPEGANGEKITFVIHRKDIWVWIIPFSNGISSVGVVGNPEFFMEYETENYNEFLQTMIADVPEIQDRFKGATVSLDAKVMQAYAVSAKQLYGPGYVITGNSSEFIDPVFSSGVTFATESGLLGAKLVTKELEGKKVDWAKEYVEHMKQGVETFRTYVNSWYDGTLQDIFFYSHADANQDIKRKICSVLAGYVWDETNPFVTEKRDRALNSISKLIQVS
jgi:flavin-dependent dehydrogenase